MKLETWQRDRNERCMERHQLSIERLQMIEQEETVLFLLDHLQSFY